MPNGPAPHTTSVTEAFSIPAVVPRRKGCRQRSAYAAVPTSRARAYGAIHRPARHCQHRLDRHDVALVQVNQHPVTRGVSRTTVAGPAIVCDGAERQPVEIAAGLNTKGGPRMNRESSAAVRMSSCLVALPRGRMHLVTSGPRTGHPVILLHGWPGYWYDYRRVIPLVSPQVRVVAPDFLGFGHSDIPSGDPVNAADQQVFAGDVLDLMDRLEIEQAVVVGHDIGSAVAPSLARIAPTRVRGLVLLNPTHPHIGPSDIRPPPSTKAGINIFTCFRSPRL